MSSIVPWDGVYRIQNVGYPDQKIGLELYLGGAGWIVAGRHEDSDTPRIEWQVKATQVGQGLISKIIIKSDDQNMPDYYIGADSGKVVHSVIPYEWDVPYREVGRWVIQDPVSGLLLYLRGGEDRTPVQLTEDGAGEVSYWRFIPIRPPSN